MKIELFVYHPQNRIFIYQIYLYAVLPDKVDAHLRSTKYRTRPSKRREIQAQMIAIAEAIQTRLQLRDELIIPPPG